MNVRSKKYIIKLRPQTASKETNPNKKLNPGNIRADVLFGLNLDSQHNDEPLFSKPVHLDITFYFPIPENTRKQLNLDDFHVMRPHITNLLDFIINIMKGVVITKPDIICSIDVKKRYAKAPMTHITITEIS